MPARAPGVRFPQKPRIVVLRYKVIRDQASEQPFALPEPSSFKRSPPMLFTIMLTIFPLPDGLPFGFFWPVITAVIDLYWINMLTNGPL